MPSQVRSSSLTFPSAVYTNGYGYTISGGKNVVSEANRRSRVWSRTPNYSKVKSGLLSTLPYTDDQWIRTIEPFTAVFPTLNGGCSFSNVLGNFDLPSLGFEADTSDCLARAITNAASKTGDYTVNLGVTGAEAGKTIGMFNNAVRSIASALGQVRGGNLVGAAATLGLGSVPKGAGPNRSVSGNWLEYRYGWRTAMMDVDGAIRHLAQTIVSQPTIVVVKSSIQTESRWTDSVWRGTGNSLPSSMSVEVLQNRRFKRSTGASITYRFVVTNPSLSNANQLGLVNPAALAWELIPYSFVADWFVNAGEVITNLTSFVGKTLLDGCQTRWASTVCTAKAVQVRAEFTIGSPVSATNVSERRLFERTKVGWLSVTPRFNINLTGSRLVDAGALLRQLTSR